MPIISADLAKAHLKLDSDADDLILSLYIGAAEQSASDYLNRQIFADTGEMSAAIAGVSSKLSAATAAYQAAGASANLIDDALVREAAISAAASAYLDALTLARETCDGIVVNDAITAAVLLTLGDLYAFRENTVAGVSLAALPVGARALLQPYRRGLGV